MFSISKYLKKSPNIWATFAKNYLVSKKFQKSPNLVTLAAVDAEPVINSLININARKHLFANNLTQLFPTYLMLIFVFSFCTESAITYISQWESSCYVT